MAEQHEITLKEFILEKFAAIEKSVELARVGMEKRLDGMNEFRQTLKDQNSTFITRKEIEVIVDKLGADIRVLRESKAMLEGKADKSLVNVTLIISIIGIIISAITLFLRFGNQ